MYVLKSTAKKKKKSVNLLSVYLYKYLSKLHMNVFVLLYRNIFLRKKNLFSCSVRIFLNDS